MSSSPVAPGPGVPDGRPVTLFGLRQECSSEDERRRHAGDDSVSPGASLTGHLVGLTPAGGALWISAGRSVSASETADSQLTTVEPESRVNMLLGRIKRGYVLIRQSISVMREHPRLALFPAVGGVASVAFLALLLTPMFGVLAVDPGGTVTLVAVGGTVLGLYLGTAFLSAFFAAGLVHQTRAVLAGEEPSLRSGLRGAWAVKRPLFVWAAISATVGVALDAIANSDSLVARALAAVFGIAWTLMTFFVVPVIVFERPSTREMFTRSASTFKRTFGETPISLIGLNIVAIVAALPLLAPGAYLLLAAELPMAGVPLLVVGILLSQLLAYTLRGIVKTSLYYYAVEGERPDRFGEVFDQLDESSRASASPGPETGRFR